MPGSADVGSGGEGVEAEVTGGWVLVGADGGMESGAAMQSLLGHTVGQAHLGGVSGPERDPIS